MARLQDFQTVTPSDSDNLLVVQATGQGLATVGSTIGNKAHKSDLASISITGTTNNSGYTIAKGYYFYVNGTLAKALEDIPNTQSLTLNTNYVLVTAGGLNSLFASLEKLQLEAISSSAITDANTLKNFLPNVTFNTGTNIITIQNASKVPFITLFMNCLNNNYGYGIAFGYYASHVYTVLNTNRTFTVTQIA